MELDDGLLNNELEPNAPSCPLNHLKCPILDELRHLKAVCKKLQELATIDPLTGFFNLRYLLTSLDVEMERSRRTGLPVSLIMIDLDHFKRINDTYGHETGNKALEWVCMVWRNNIRRVDIPCRYGGEEFALILPGTHLADAIRLAEKLRGSIVGSPLVLDKKQIFLTASFGVDVYKGYKGKKDLSAKSFIDHTDRFLLTAKAAGRNCVRPEISEPTFTPTEVTDDERRGLFKNSEPKT